MSLLHTPDVEILWTWHMSRSQGRPALNVTADPEGFLRLSFGARFDRADSHSAYVATMTMIHRDSGRAHHHSVPWHWRADLGSNEIMFQLLWRRAADATHDQRGLFLFQPTLIFLSQAQSIEGADTPVATWVGESLYAIAPEPHYILMEGDLRTRPYVDWGP